MYASIAIPNPSLSEGPSFYLLQVHSIHFLEEHSSLVLQESLHALPQYIYDIASFFK